MNGCLLSCYLTLDSTIETILAILELSPFNFLEVFCTLFLLL